MTPVLVKANQLRVNDVVLIEGEFCRVESIGKNSFSDCMNFGAGGKLRFCGKSEWLTCIEGEISASEIVRGKTTSAR